MIIMWFFSKFYLYGDNKPDFLVLDDSCVPDYLHLLVM